MFDTLVCYDFNTCPETVRLCHKLDVVIRQMVKNQTIDEILRRESCSKYRELLRESR
jgi:hypothetical protein